MPPRRSVLLLAAVAAMAASCGAPLMKLPSGPGSPVSTQDAAASLAQATGSCSALRTLTAEVAVSGSAGGHRLRGRLSAGVAAPSAIRANSPASVRLEAVAPFGPPLFIFVATGDDATLLLPRDDRVLEHGRADAVLDAVAGVPLGAADLESTLTGCPADERPGPMPARQFGDSWQQLTRGTGDLYLHREKAGQPWVLAAVVRRDDTGRAWRTEYRDRAAGVPRTIRVASLDPPQGHAAFNLQLVLSQVETNVALDASVFSIVIPKSAAPISLEELRRDGPLAPKSGSR